MPSHTTLVRKPPPTLSIHSLALCVGDVHVRSLGLFLRSFLRLFLCLPYTRSLYTLSRAFPAAFPTPFLWPFLRLPYSLPYGLSYGLSYTFPMAFPMAFPRVFPSGIPYLVFPTQSH
ncbi:hypothetical protein IEO21_07654 [Rhodonia placenta]|uniref:Uncharacterized protein n=1 Tax=Rhodonia placenta TaxID=104341 RepID=A0A8H7NY50_9APHY|nr:hypothetical protein IEO21_07654 [Postia placenta]